MKWFSNQWQDKWKQPAVHLPCVFHDCLITSLPRREGLFWRLLSLLADADLICKHRVLENPGPLWASWQSWSFQHHGSGGLVGWKWGRKREAIRFLKTSASVFTPPPQIRPVISPFGNRSCSPFAKAALKVWTTTRISLDQLGSTKTLRWCHSRIGTTWKSSAFCPFHARKMNYSCPKVSE